MRWMAFALILFAGCSDFEIKAKEKPPLMAYPGDKVKLKIGIDGVVESAYQYRDGNKYVISYKDNEGRAREVFVGEYELEK